ncbi:MAG: HAMP domain-containing histidine kinase [Deinococcus sp.]|nr:HAMP domain-containing histidine kinase [Deinococcus sp.]
MALWYGGLTGLVVFLASLLTYAVHSRIHYDPLDQSLVRAVEHVAGEYAADSTPQELTAQLTVLLSPDTTVRLYDATGQVVAASPNATLAPVVDPRAVLTRPSEPPFDPLIGLAPSLIAVNAGRGRFGLATDPTGSRWRLYVLPVSGSARYLVAAAPLGRIDTPVERLRQLVPLLTLLGAIVTLVGGGLMAGSALRPVAVLTETAGAIARARSFNRRVPVGSRRDELGQLAATFNEMLNSLERAYQAQQRFVADASHELRAPLTAIQGNLELLRRQRATMSEAERQEALTETEREAARLARLVADLLALARADAGVPLQRYRVELDRVLLDAFSEARQLVRGQTLELESFEPAQVMGDADRLKQLLLILLDNALKYTPAEGKVLLGLRRDGSTAEVIVRDTGVGIPPEDLPHVFERFYRADPARARDPGGTGLGLPIAQWIAEQHGGRITLQSQLGQGTIATVRLPLHL